MSSQQSPPDDSSVLTVDELLARIDRSQLPRHIAIIMDGNGRWARQRGLPRIAGHREGIKSVRDVITLSREIGIPALTIYAFSSENWSRPAEEVGMLMGLLEQYLKKEFDTLMNNGIRFRTIGRTDRLPSAVVCWIEKVEAATAANDKMTLTIALNYGGRADILDGVHEIMRRVHTGLIRPADIDEASFASYLSTAGLPDPDLMIRTSGETRISNFLLWQVAYTELYFTKTLWPDFRKRDFLLALYDYVRRERRFGAVTEPRCVDG